MQGEEEKTMAQTIDEKRKPSGNGLKYDSAVLSGCELFLLVTIIWMLASPLSGGEKFGNIMLCLMTSVLLVTPWVFEKTSKMNLPALLKVLFIFLIIGGPVLGKIYKFYYRFSLWDKLLHTSSGFLFAVIGAMIPQLLDKENASHSFALELACAMCFTLAIAAVWEFFEFSMDKFFGMDMQQDTLLTGINSYLLGSGTGVLGSIENIESVTINGIDTGMAGYIDIGLIDTMGDMLVCTVGGILYCVLRVLYKKGKKVAAWLSKLLPSMMTSQQEGLASSETK